MSSAELVDHWWWRPGWRLGRRMWTWHVTFDEVAAGQELHHLADAHRGVLDVPGFDVVPRRWLHLTVQGLGFTDEVTDVDAVVAAAQSRAARLEPFDVDLGPALIRGDGVGLLADPAAPLHALRQELRNAIADVWGAARVPGEEAGFRPHVSLAYSNTAWDASALVPALPGVEPATARVRVAEAQLIRLGRDEREYRWDDARTVVLGTPGTPGAQTPTGVAPSRMW